MRDPRLSGVPSVVTDGRTGEAAVSRPVVPRLLWALPRIYLVAALRLALPLLVLPMVATRVGAEEFGRLSFILVWSALLSLVVEGGFLAAATRVAVTADTDLRWRLARQIFSARVVLCVPVLLLAAVTATLAGGSHPFVDALAIAALAIVLGWPATWYLQATQQLGRWAGIEFVVYGALLVGCGFFARSVPAFVALQFVASATLAFVGWRWLRRDLAPSSPAASLWAPDEIGAGLRLGWKMLPVSIAGAVYSFALPAAASAQMPRAELGVYYLADRVVRAVLAGADPVFSVVYPRIVALFHIGRGRALRYALRWAAMGGTAGLALLALVWVSQLAITSLLGSRFAAIDGHAVQAVLLALAWLWPILLGWKFIGYWLLGSGRYDTAYRVAAFIGAIVGVAVVASWSGASGAVGLAQTAVAVELLVIVAQIVGALLTRRRERA